MDSDDLSHPERLKRQVAAFDLDPDIVCVGSNIQLIDSKGRFLGVETYPLDHERISAEQMTTGGGLRFPSTMQRRSVATSVGGFRQPFRIGEDFDYLLRIGERGRMANLPQRLYFYRQHLMSTVTALGVDWLRYREVILSLARERRAAGSDRLQQGLSVVVPQTTSEDARKHIPDVLLWWAQGALSNGDRSLALRYAIKAIGAAPFKRTAWRYLAKLLLLRNA
jgi:hypothetical protein